MTGGGPGRAWRRGRQFAFGPPQMGAFVTALAGGATMAAAARKARVAVSTLYYRRRTCAAFAAAWDAAAAASAGPVLVLARRGRGWQLQRSPRRLRFGRERKQAFLDHFAATCNIEAAAAAAGVGITSVYRHLQYDAAFARGFQEALETGHPLLEAEAARERLAAQEAYRIDPAAHPEEAALGFERTMQLLREYKRGHGRIGRRPVGRRLTKWSFEEAFEALETRLKAFGMRIDRGEREEDEAGDEGAEAAAAGPAGPERAPPRPRGL